VGLWLADLFVDEEGEAEVKVVLLVDFIGDDDDDFGISVVVLVDVFVLLVYLRVLKF
jgi:hypothetical protein